MNARSCQHCDTTFSPKRSTARFCSDKCRKDAHQREKRKAHPVNAKNSHAERRAQMELFERNMRLAEMYYTRAPRERPAFLLELIRLAVEGHSRVKRVLTNREFLRPSPFDEHKFWRGESNYPTVAQEAHRLCKAIVGVGIASVINGSRELFDQLASAEPQVLEAALQWDTCPTSPRRNTGRSKRQRKLSTIALRAYEAALAPTGVSVVRTERRDAA